LPINTEMVRKFTIILSNNILLVAGPETFEMIKTMSLGNGEAFFQKESAMGLSTMNKGQLNTQRKTWWKFNFFKRTIAPMEVLRTIVRDITILTVFFTILQSEFDLLSREKEENDRTRLFTAIAKDSGIKFQPKTIEAFNNYFQSNNWIKSGAFKVFKSQLPKNNLNIAINDSVEGIQRHVSEDSNPGPPDLGGRRITRKSKKPKRKTRK